MALNVADDVDLPSHKPPVQEVWSPAQLRTFLEHTKGDRLAAAWRLLATTGMRRGEVVGLRWASVDLAKGTIRIDHARVMVGYSVQTSAPKTEAGRRTLALDPATVALLRSWRATQAKERLQVGAGYRDSGYVFTTPDGSPIHPQRFSVWFAAASKRARLPVIRLHDARHSYATAGLEAGVPLKVMSGRLGHANTQITADLYQHVLPATDQAAADQIAAIIDG